MRIFILVYLQNHEYVDNPQKISVSTKFGYTGLSEMNNSNQFIVTSLKKSMVARLNSVRRGSAIEERKHGAKGEDEDCIPISKHVQKILS